MTRSMRCPMGVPVAGGIEAECPTHHATEHHLPATTRTRQAGDGDNRETTSLRQTHLRLTLKPPLVKHLPLKPQLFQRTPQLRIRVRLGVGAARILPPSVTPPIFRPIIWGGPILQPKDQQLRRSRRPNRFTVRRHYGTHSHNPRFTCTSPRTHSSRQNLSSSPRIFTAGGRRCTATSPTPLRGRSKLSELAAAFVLLGWHLAPPTPLSGLPGMPTASTSTDFLRLVRKVQGACEALQQQAVSPDFLEQWMRLQLAGRARRSELRQGPNRPFQAI